MDPKGPNVAKTSDKLPHDVRELMTAILDLPADHRERIEILVNRVADSTRRRRRILALVQDALGQLRLDMKYLMFDLEATRRERDSFQADLERGEEY